MIAWAVTHLEAIGIALDFVGLLMVVSTEAALEPIDDGDGGTDLTLGMPWAMDHLNVGPVAAYRIRMWGWTLLATGFLLQLIAAV